MKTSKIRCNVVPYRKGFVEVTPGIHEGCINLETWGIRADIDISKLNVRDERLPDGCVTGNTELEMSNEAAEELIEALRAAIGKVRIR